MGQKKKTASMFIRLVSAAGTGFFYVKKKNPKNFPQNSKLEFRKYDPRVNRHVLFTEAKMK
ncbi:50S ribosomal protein L33 [Impatiens glandulifera]|uniref:50S ribosomal protein L33-like n=1 Tax=Impatiens glandulifera TaxID=253017 RepID=UPI001FB10FEC|nr:50S ribosomal protein L33-like [Impatiens glandulifera]XP_047338784.1 50S ribosomal protein L33 [Impatiens glandulifera]